MKTKFTFSSHPIIRHKLELIKRRENKLDAYQCQNALRDLGAALAYEATRELSFDSLQNTREPGTLALDPALVTVVRQGIFIAEGIQRVIPVTSHGHISIEDDIDGKPDEVFTSLPLVHDDQYILIADSYINSGRTLSYIISIFDEFGISPDRLILLCLACSEQGREHIESNKYQGFRVFAGHLDTKDDVFVETLFDLNSRTLGTPSRLDQRG